RAPHRPCSGYSCHLPYCPNERNATLSPESIGSRDGAASRPRDREGWMRTAVVTGAARGLGRAISERLVADGFTVWALDTDEAEVAGMADEVGATACAIDVTDEAAVDDLAARLGQ